MVRAMRLLNAIEAGTLSGASLQSLLTADAGRLAELNVLLGMRGQARRMAASSTAMTAVIASSTAMTAVTASSTAMAAVNTNDQAVRIWMLAGTNQVYSDFVNVAAVAASSTAMTAVAASSTAMAAVAASSTAMTAVWASDTASDAVLTSSTAKLAVYNSDTALAALQANPTQVQRQVTARAVRTSTSTSAYVFVANGTKAILLRRRYNATEHDMIDWARNSTTAAVGQGPVGGSRNLDTGAQALGCTSGTYTSNGTMPTTDDATANFVSAANGLQRRGWNTGATLYVDYILV